MAESMEVLRKQNEELNTRLTAAEARSSQKERERAERREKERRDRVRRESGLLILIKRITRAQSRGIVERSTMKRTAISLAVWRLRMEDREGKVST
jgi:hypothetical protein